MSASRAILAMMSAAVLTAAMASEPTPTHAPPQAARPAPDDLGLKRIIGMTVHDVAGREFGVVTDVLLDIERGRVLYFELSPGRDPSRRLMATSGQLWVATGDPGVVHTPMSDARLVLSVTEPSLTAPPADPSSVSTQPLRHPVRGSDLIGAVTVRPDGDRFGRVSDVVLDLDDGRILSVLMERGGWLGDVIAVPPEALDARARDGTWTVVADAPRSAAGVGVGVERKAAPVESVRGR